MRLQIVRVVVVDGVLGGHELVDATLRVAFEAVGVAAALAVAAYVAVGCQGGEGVGVAGAEVEGRNAVEGCAGEGGVVDSG